MSALRAVAWGMVDLEKLIPKQFRKIRGNIRAELKHSRLWIKRGGDQNYSVRCYPYGNRQRKMVERALTFKAACEVALRVIETTTTKPLTQEVTPHEQPPIRR
jgi:hypothetical protein